MTVDNIELTPHFEQLIARLVESGEYQSASEVLEDGLRMLEESRIEEAAAFGEEFQRLVKEGLGQLERGEGIELHGDQELRDYIQEIADRVCVRHKKRVS